MKKLLLFFAALLMAGSMMAQDVMEINLTDRNSMDYGTDVMITYSNAEYKVVLDVLTNFQWAADQSYGLANVDNEFSFVEEISTSRRYLFTALTFVFGANMEDVEVTGTAVNGSETISIHAVYPAPAEPTATVTLFSNGQEKVAEDEGEYSLYTLDAIQFSMDNLTSDMDYTYALMDAEMNPLVFGQNVPVTATPHMDLTITPESPIVLNEGATYVFVLQIRDNAADEVVFATMCYIQGLTPATPTALENIATDAKSSKTSKLIKNGKLVIIKDGKKYNVVGQQM